MPHQQDRIFAAILADRCWGGLARSRVLYRPLAMLKERPRQPDVGIADGRLTVRRLSPCRVSAM
jgi:hypothetical protein